MGGVGFPNDFIYCHVSYFATSEVEPLLKGDNNCSALSFSPLRSNSIARENMYSLLFGSIVYAFSAYFLANVRLVLCIKK